MKFFNLACLLITILAAVLGAGAAGEPQKTPVFAVDFVKIKDGERENFRKFIEQNWARARAFMKEKGIVASYLSLTAPAPKDAAWDALLITEYIDRESYGRSEEVYEEYRRTNPLVRIDGKTPRDMRDMSEIKSSRDFDGRFSEEVWEIMLKTQSDDAELAAARVPLENYLKGHATGDPEYMRKAFYREGKLIFVRDGKYATRTFDDYINGMSGKPAADEARRRRWIESVEISGNAGFGKIILDYPDVRFVDYMTLLKIDGEWKIVNKSFYAEPKSAPPGK